MQDGLQLQVLKMSQRGLQQSVRKVRRGARMPQALEGAVRVQRVPVENHAHMQASLLVVFRQDYVSVRDCGGNPGPFRIRRFGAGRRN